MSERLKEIKRETKPMAKMVDPPIYYRELNEVDYKHLIGQAEQNKRLTERNEEIYKGLMVTVDELVEATEKIEELEKQNKRYRKALEFYADKETYEIRFIGKEQKPRLLIEIDEGKTAREELED